MKYTLLLTNILEKANKVKEEFKCEYLYASHIAVAVADFCKNDYTGFSVSDMTYHPARFEEERLRYIFRKEIKLTSYFRLCLSRNIRLGIKEDEFDMKKCENIAVLRDAEVLSSDIVFLCALKDMQAQYKGALRNSMSDDVILEVLHDADINIYDYVIENIEKVCTALIKKADEAKAIRDWKPAEKFAEPQELEVIVCKNIEYKVVGNVVTLKIHKFFISSDLKLSIHKVGDIYYIHDNCCTIKNLNKRVQDNIKCGRILRKVCHSSWIDKGKITGSFINAYGFIYYLQKLIFVAYADLYYTKAVKHLYFKEKDYIYLSVRKAELINVNDLFVELKKGLCFDYDENEGLSYWIDMRYSLFSTRSSFLIETLADGQIRISDRRKGKIEGEIFEAFYWDNDDISQYSKFIIKIAECFGAEFDGRDVYLTVKQKDFFRGICKFFSLAVLLSEFGHDIDLPKIRKAEKKE